jgi:hypothetical protein
MNYNHHYYYLFQCIDVPEIVPPEFKDSTSTLPHIALSSYQHPVSHMSQRYALGDRFHSASNPHKSHLCRFHDINLCNQAITLKTSIQESQNQRKKYQKAKKFLFTEF